MSAPPFKVKATFDYSSPHEDDLSFAIGQIITVTEIEDDDWYVGEYTSDTGATQTGLFPKNFVEKYEPEAPPRPTRARSKKEPTAPVASTSEASLPPEPTQQATRAPASEPQPIVVEPPAEPAAAATKSPPAPVPPREEPVKATPPGKGPPPPVADKPSSFKDRIAAFNKPQAAPIAPVKPSGAAPSGSGFIKKPFVAPPPSRDAYVPRPQQQAAAKIYRREEDPEIARQQAQDLEDAEKAGLVAHEHEGEEEQTEEVAKATSLKDRIALLQKQQQEQARRAELAAKEKPKRPPKKRTDSTEQAAITEDTTELTRSNTGDSASRKSIEILRDVPKPPSRRTSLDPGPPREQHSDGNDADQSGAGDTTEDTGALSTELDEEEAKTPSEPPKPLPRVLTGGSSRRIVEDPGVVEEEDEEQDDEVEEEEDEMDAETRRKMELRERMAKMSGGLGMHGMMGTMPKPGGASNKKTRSESRTMGSEEAASPPQRLPMVPIPGVPRAPTAESENTELAVEREPEPSLPHASTRPPEQVPDVEDLEPDQPQAAAAPRIPQGRPLPPPPSSATSPPRAVPPVPGSRPVPQPPEGRPVPPPPPVAAMSPGPGSESDDEMPSKPPEVAQQDLPTRAPPPPVPSGAPPVPSRSEVPRSPPAARSNRSSYMGDPGPITSSTEKQSSRAPPVPAPAMPPPSTESRPPPPPPPTAAPRRSTDIQDTESPDDDDDSDGEVNYEGDYDTDIGSAVPHRAALKAHDRQVSMDEETLSGDNTAASPRMAPPPPPPPDTSRPPPPPPPQQAPTASRKSTEAPRAPPPVPPPAGIVENNEYDPYRYSEPATIIPQRSPQIPEPHIQASDPSLYSAPKRQSMDRAPPPVPQSPPSQHRLPPPPPVHEELPAPGSSSRELPRGSADGARTSMNAPRPSSDQPRTSADQGFLARDVDLDVSSQWWAQPNVPPPIFQRRPDVLCEFEESSTSKRGGRKTISKDVYILFVDYSQTVVSVRFDAGNVSDASLEQRHEPPPARPRQDQLEDAHRSYGGQTLATATSMQNQTIGDGSAQALIVEVLRGQAAVLLPIGIRAYGALVYANMGNASVQQFDEIRGGDVISFRNARFQGKHGAMHAKYSEDVGKPEHVAIVAEWDGTKKKVRALEQGRDGKKVKIESFRLGDLRSGEVKVWRVMGRSWIGWDSS